MKIFLYKILAAILLLVASVLAVPTALLIVITFLAIFLTIVVFVFGVSFLDDSYAASLAERLRKATEKQ